MRNRPVLHLSETERVFARRLVIHEDRALLALNKPSGLPCELRGGREGQTLDRLLAAFARSNGKRPHLAHRLDAGTSGVILAAQTKPAAAALQRAFEDRLMAKTYLAIVTGNLPASRQGRIDQPIRRVRHGKGERAQVCQLSDRLSQTAMTDWRTLAKGDGSALMELKPVTGRMHQIRVHLGSIGLIIAGEERYGAGEPAARLMLHAAKIAGPHPDGGRFSHSAPVPDDFAALAARLGLAVGLKDA